MKRTLILTAFFALSQTMAGAQDVQFARVTSIPTWYNTSLKMDKKVSADVLFRNVSYEGITAIRSSLLMVNLPFSLSPNKGNANAGFFNVNVGAVNDRMTNSYINSTNGVLGISYAQPLGNSVHMAAGFQGALYQSSLNLGNANFPDQFDKFGLIPAAVTKDPMRNGGSISWFSLNTGISIFKSGQDLKWYAGVSLRHLNRPVVNRNIGGDYKMPVEWGVQAGIQQKVEDDVFGAYTNVNWRAQSNEYLFGIRYGRVIDHSKQAPTVTFGCAYRVGDAMIPHFDFSFQRTTIGIHYDVNISGIKASAYRRQGLEIGLTQLF